MEAPILDFFEEEGIINKKLYIKNSKVFDRMQKLQANNINTALLIFNKTDISDVVDTSKLQDFYSFVNGSNINKCYIYDNKFVLATTPLGGPAAAGLMEELGFMGITNFFICGSAGQIDTNIDSKNFVIVEKAIRCEGTSYRYIKPSLYVETDKQLSKVIENYLKANKFTYITANTWTTDTFFRETQSELNLRVSQGAVCVEMECASLAAVAKHRGYKFAQLLYFSDAVNQDNWAWKTNKTELKFQVINLMIDCVLQFVKNKN